jgi:hypothetical protein
VQATSGELRGDDRANRCHQGEQSKRPHLEPRVAGGRIRQHPLAAGHHQQDDRLRPGIHPQRPSRLLLAILVGWLVPPPRRLARPGPACCCCRLVQRTARRRRGRTMAGRLLQRRFGFGQATVEQHDLAGHRRHPWKLTSGLEHQPSPLLPLDKALHGQRAARIPGKARPDRRSGQGTVASGDHSNRRPPPVPPRTRNTQLTGHARLYAPFRLGSGWVASWRPAGAPQRPHRWVWVSARCGHRMARGKHVAARCGHSPSRGPRPAPADRPRRVAAAVTLTR